MRWFNSILTDYVKKRMSVDLRFWYRSAAVGLTIAIGVLSSLPGKGVSHSSNLDPDHIVAYVFLTIFWLLAWGKRLPRTFIAIGVVGYGCILELLQIGIPGREAIWLDLVANCLGVLIGWALMMTLQGFSRGKA